MSPQKVGISNRQGWSRSGRNTNKKGSVDKMRLKNFFGKLLQFLKIINIFLPCKLSK